MELHQTNILQNTKFQHEGIRVCPSQWAQKRDIKVEINMIDIYK